MQAFLTELFTRIRVPEADAAALLAAYQRTVESGDAPRFSSLARRFYEERLTLNRALAEWAPIGERLGISIHTLTFLQIAHTVRELIPLWCRDYPEAILWDTLQDLGYKEKICRAVQGVAGTFHPDWYEDMLRRGIFALGRLQFQPRLSPLDYEGERLTLKKGDPVLFVHIPEAGPLRPEDCLDSYRRAFAFFPKIRVGGVLPLLCDSWLLYPGNADFLPPTSNIEAFRRSFTPLMAEEDPKNEDLWRIFDCFWQGDAAALPEGTRLQRDLKAYLLAGHNMGIGWGLIAFDGERSLE